MVGGYTPCMTIQIQIQYNQQSSQLTGGHKKQKNTTKEVTQKNQQSNSQRNSQIKTTAKGGHITKQATKEVCSS